jgi:hypothetical protein
LPSISCVILLLLVFVALRTSAELRQKNALHSFGSERIPQVDKL